MRENAGQLNRQTGYHNVVDDY